MLLVTGEDNTELTLIKSLNMSFCINSLEMNLARVLEQQSTIIAEQKLHREQLDRVNEQLWNIKSQQDMIKNRQEMIFTKQDQIQYTLHGETRTFQSPPILSSPPMTSPFGSVPRTESLPRPAFTASIAIQVNIHQLRRSTMIVFST